MFEASILALSVAMTDSFKGYPFLNGDHTKYVSEMTEAMAPTSGIWVITANITPTIVLIDADKSTHPIKRTTVLVLVILFIPPSPF